MLRVINYMHCISSDTLNKYTPTSDKLEAFNMIYQFRYMFNN